MYANDLQLNTNVFSYILLISAFDASSVHSFRLGQYTGRLKNKEKKSLLEYTLVYWFSRGLGLGLAGVWSGGAGGGSNLTSHRGSSPWGGLGGNEDHMTSNIIRASLNANSRFISNKSHR